MKFRDLQSAIDCYGRTNLVPVTQLKQILFYTRRGLQPVFISEHETNQGILTCWYLKDETKYAYKAWGKMRPTEVDE